MDETGAGAGVQSKHHYMLEISFGPRVPDPVTLSKKGQDIITWECAFDPNWIVDFGTDSPFKNSVFNQNNPTSGPVRNEAALKYFKYTVTAGRASQDPGVIVDP
jgi:hypothetical protein